MDCAAANDQSYDSWPELNLLYGLEADHVRPTDLEEIYAGIHNSVDQAVSTISQQGRFTRETIKQQNLKVFEKLSRLENVILPRIPLTSTSSLPETGTSTIPLKSCRDVEPL